MLGSFLSKLFSRKWFSRNQLTIHRQLPKKRTLHLRRRMDLESLDLRILPTVSGLIAFDDYSSYAPAQVQEDSSTSIAVLDNDVSPESLPLSIVSVAPAAHGSVVVNGDNTLTYTPDADYFGSDSFQYQITDGVNGDAWATVYLDVAPVNDDPIASDDGVYAPLTTNEDTPLTAIDVLGNDSDIDGDTLIVSIYSQASHGVATVNSDGTIDYTPDAEYFGADSFVYQVDDGNGGLAWATVYLDVASVNDTPIASDDGVYAPLTTNEDTPLTAIDVLGNDSDIDGDTLIVSIYSQASHGAATVNGDGTIDYTPDTGFFGSDSFVYQISDSNGGFAWATVYLDVGQVNQAPIASDDNINLYQNQASDLSVLVNDFDPDADPLTVSIYSSAGHATVVANGDGTITYTPDAGYYGYDSFVYQVSDGNGGEAWATVYLYVIPVNLTPVAGDDIYSLNENTSLDLTVLANDLDPDADPLTVSIYSSAGHGSVVVNSDGTITYTPDAGYFGYDSFVYQISDGNGGEAWATVTLDIAFVNNDPIVTNDEYLVDEDTPLIVNVFENDFDPDGDILWMYYYSGAEHGSVEYNSDGTLTYTPNENYVGPDLIYYLASDDHGGTAWGTVYITVLPVNDAPMANDVYGYINEDESLSSIDVLSNCYDLDGDSLTVSIASGASHGTVIVNGDGTLTYTPEANFFGEDSFVYQVSDGNGGEAWATVYVNVLAVAEPAPTLTLDVEYGEHRMVTLSGVVTGENVGGLTVTFSGAVNGTTVTDADGSYSFTVEATCLGEVYAVTENEELTPSNVATVVIESAVPEVIDFTATALSECQYQFTGRVVDEWAAGLVIVFNSGMTISGQTVTVEADGTFMLLFEFQAGEWGIVEARVADCWSSLSAPAQAWVAQS